MEHSSLFRKHIKMINYIVALPIRPTKGGRIIILWLLLFACHARGQQLFFDRFSVAEGLAQSTVFKVIQDRNDILWLGTGAGVSRFDGAEFKNFSAEQGLAENGVRAICEDRYGNIWFGHSGGGISRYSGKQFDVYKRLGDLINSNVTSIVEDSLGHIWITSLASGVIELFNPEEDLENIVFEQYTGSEISDRVFSGYVDHHGELWFVADPNVKKYNPDSSRFDNVLLNGIPQYYATTCIVVDHKGNIWFGKYNGGLYRYSPLSNDSEMFDLIKSGLSSNWVSTLYEDNRGNIWAGTWGGGVAMISPEGKIELYSNRNGLQGMKIWTIMQDREENILIGTQENGLCVYKGDQFISYFEEDGLINSQVWAILQGSDGKFWFGTNEGISILQKNHEEYLFRDFQKLKGGRIRFLKEDRDGTIWIGSQNQGVYRYSRQGNLYFDPVINNNIERLQLTAMDLDSDNNLWMGTLDGLIYFEIDNRKVARLSQVNGLRGNEISAVFADSRNHIWVGSSGKGISVIREDSIEQLDLGLEFTPRCLMEDNDGNIWIGTEGRGVILYNPFEERVITTLTVSDGLLANLINQLSCDRYNNVYIGTNKGLNTYIRKEEAIYSYTYRSGFVGIETKPNASLVDSEGNIWFGTVLGATRFQPSEEGQKVIEPLTHIIDFQVNNESFPLVANQRLSYKQNSIIFEYRCITLNPDAVKYQIMLEGVDHDWRPPDTQTRVTYPALRHGRYLLKVKARNSKGIWNQKPVTFGFEIRPPFYLTWYFILAAVLAVALIIFTYIKIREQALRRENAILEEKVKDRTAIVVAQKEELAQKNKDITDSIRYAKRIQFAILPEKSPYPDTFILFKPKDIVSGDFYWFTKVDGREYFSAVDCTGHGVPGAFMSIIGHNSLTKIVREYGILEPGKILTQLNKEVISTLQQRSDSTDVLDGMDLALACYHPVEKLLEFSGAFNPLYLIREGKIIEIKADKVSIGRSSFNTGVDFTNHQVEIKPGDTVYLFSDGYADQFGGKFMKKFKYRNLKELLIKIQPETMDRQRIILNQTIEEWRGNVDQLDDILMIGRRF